MDFNDSPLFRSFRAEVRAWLEANAPEFHVERRGIGEDTEADLRRAKAWQKRKADAGYACLLWPEEYGGPGRTPIEAVIYSQEESRYSVPRGVFEIGQGMAGPVLMMYAAEEQKKRYLPPMLTGEEIWCQLFSEPAAGSDLAGLRTRAEKDGDEWIVNGQKVWTSGAHFSDWGILVTRHDPTIPKHMGLTYFFVDMRAPGVEIRRIRQISGASNFCEVFFNDVRIPDTQRLGGVGDGWSVALTTLMNERLAVGDAPPPDADELIRLAQSVEFNGAPALKDRAVRDRIADWHVQMTGLKFTKYRTMTALSRGQTPGPEASIAKLVGASKLQDIGSFGMDVLGMGGAAMDDVPGDGLFQHAYLSAPGLRVAGGTDEILMNIIAERVLKLPPEIRVDKDVAFNALPTGAS